MGAAANVVAISAPVLDSLSGLMVVSEECGQQAGAVALSGMAVSGIAASGLSVDGRAAAEMISLGEMFAEARRCHARNELRKAAEGYRGVLEGNPQSEAALLGLSLIARQSRQWEPALRMAEAALKVAPIGSLAAGLALSHRGHCLAALRRKAEAEVSFRAALELGDTDLELVVREAARREAAGETVTGETVTAGRTVEVRVGDGLRRQVRIQALIGLGELFVFSDRARDAVKCFELAVALDPTLAAGHYGLANALALTDDYEAALARFQQVIELIPGCVEAHFAVGFSLAQLGRHGEAIEGYQRALGLRRDFASAWLNMGVALAADGQGQLAIPCYCQALVCAGQSKAPVGVDRLSTQISAYLNLGQMERMAKRFDKARKHYERALALGVEGHARHGEILLAFAYLHLEQEEFAEAWAALEQAEAAERAWNLSQGRKWGVANAEIPNARGILLMAEEAAEAGSRGVGRVHDGERLGGLRPSGRLGRAIEFFTEAEALGHKTAASNRGNALLRMGRCRESLEAQKVALALDPVHPGVRYNMALTQLRLGDYAEGWPNYEVRWRFREVHPRPRRFAQPRWTGTEIGGETGRVSLLIFGEQGLGDTLQFFRYVRLVAARLAKGLGEAAARTIRSNGSRLMVPRLIVEVQRPLERLLKPCLQRIGDDFGIGVDLVCNGDVLPVFTHHCPLLSLPAVFGTTVETVPGELPYLKADAELVAGRAVGLGLDRELGRAVGIAWAGNPKYRADHERSTRLATFLPLLEAGVQAGVQGGIRWVSLQKGGEPLAEIAQLPEGIVVVDGCSQDGDLADAAAVIANMDLVITTDTAVAHLAGALGRPLWLLLPWQADWRWMQETETSPWYPGARLFRQSAPNDWGELMERVARELALRFSTGS